MRALAERMNGVMRCPALRDQLVPPEPRHRRVGGAAGRRPRALREHAQISILMAALKAVPDGKLALDQKVIVDARYQDNDSGTFQHLTPGFWITLRDALVMMIIVSDNTCTGTVVDLVGLGESSARASRSGMSRTIHRYGIPPRLPADHGLEQVTSTTPRDQGLLLDLMLRGADDTATAAQLDSTPALCRLGLDILSWQKLNNLPALALAAGHQGRAQDGDGLARLHGCRHRLQGGPPALHPHRLYGRRARRATRWHARLRRRQPGHRPHGAAGLGRPRGLSGASSSSPRSPGGGSSWHCRRPGRGRGRRRGDSAADHPRSVQLGTHSMVESTLGL